MLSYLKFQIYKLIIEVHSVNLHCFKTCSLPSHCHNITWWNINSLWNKDYKIVCY